MKFEIHSAISSTQKDGAKTTKIRGVLPDLGCGGELLIWNDPVAFAFGTEFDPLGQPVRDGVAQTKCFSQGLYPVVDLDDTAFVTATEPNKAYLSKKTNTMVEDRVAGLEVFRIFPKSEGANWLARILASKPMPSIGSGDIKVADLASMF